MLYYRIVEMCFFNLLINMKFYLKICMFQYIISPHPVQYKLCFVGNPDDMIPHRMRQQTTLIDQLNERQPRMLL